MKSGLQGNAKSKILGTLVDKVFGVDRRVRFVGVYQEQYMLAGGMRRGRRSLDPEEEAVDIDLKLAKVGEIATAWQKWFGSLNGFAFRYAKISLAFVPLGENRFSVLSADTGLDPFDVLEKLRQDRDFGELAEAIA